MTEAETITRMRTMLAERDAEIRRLRGLLLANQQRHERLFKQALADAWSAPLPDGSCLTITFPARPE
jgi:hypothetical protein